MDHRESPAAVGRWSSPVREGLCRCEVCPRRCLLRVGQRGFCYVRRNVEGRIVSTTYGHSTGFCIDPVEKKPLNHFFPGSAVLSFGTAGCNLGCRFCQNWQTNHANRLDATMASAGPQAIALAAQRSSCTAVAFTYNDPAIWPEYAIDTARACHEMGVKTIAVSAGYITGQARQNFYQHMDAANIDLKAFSDKFYRRLCLARLQPILDTLSYVYHETNTWLEITTLIIPGYNDSPQEISQLAHWIVTELGPDVPLHLTAFHPDYRMPQVPPTKLETLLTARKCAQEAGLRYIYTGNVADAQSQTTFCAQCGHVLIERNWHQLGAWNLTAEGKCQQCSAPLAGHFRAQPGRWRGRRPLPLGES